LKSSAMRSTALCLQSSGSNEGENMDAPLQDWKIAHAQHQPGVTSVDITKSCSYSYMLLMMGENIARNL